MIKVRAVLFIGIVCSIAIILAGCRILGDFDSGETTSSPVTASTSTATSTATSGNVTLVGVIQDSAPTGSVKAVIRAAAVANAPVICGILDDNNKFSQLPATATTDANGAYQLTGLPTGVTNLIVSAIQGGASISVVVPKLPDVATISNAPVADRVTTKKAEILLNASEFLPAGVKARDLNIGDLNSLISPDHLVKLSENELKDLGKALADAEKAKSEVKSAFNISDSDYQALKKFSFELTQQIYERIAKIRQQQEVYTGDPDDLWKTYDEEMKKKIESLKLPADIVFAFQTINKNQFGLQVQQVVSSNSVIKEEVEKNTEIKKYANTFAGLTQALSDLGFESSELQGVKALLDQTLSSMKNVSKVNDIALLMARGAAPQVIFEAMRRIFDELGLMRVQDGVPLIQRLKPTEAEFKAEGATWIPMIFRDFPDFRVPPPVPTPDQVVSFQRASRVAVRKKILSGVPNLDEKKIQSLIFLILAPFELGFGPHNFGVDGFTGTPVGPMAPVSGGGPSDGGIGGVSAFGQEIVGIVKKLPTPIQIPDSKNPSTSLSYEFSIEPPSGLSIGPSNWNGILGYLRGAGLKEDLQKAVVVTTQMTGFPTDSRAPGFTVVSIREASTNDIPTLAPNSFIGKLIKKDGEFYLTIPFGSTTDQIIGRLILSNELKTKAEGLINQTVRGEGTPRMVSGQNYPDYVVTKLDADNMTFVSPPSGIPTTTTPGTFTIPLPPTQPTYPGTGTIPTPYPPDATMSYPIGTGTLPTGTVPPGTIPTTPTTTATTTLPTTPPTTTPPTTPPPTTTPTTTPPTTPPTTTTPTTTPPTTPPPTTTPSSSGEIVGMHGPIVPHPSEPGNFILNPASTNVKLVPANDAIRNGLANVPTGVYIVINEGSWITQTPPVIRVMQFSVMQ